MAAKQNETRQIRVFVKTDGGAALDRLSRQFASLNKNVKGIGSTLGSIGNAFAGFIAGIGVQQLAQAADSINLLRDRINALSGGAEQGRIVFEGLRDAAGRTRTSVESLSIVYARLAAATNDLGATSTQVLAVTEALQNSFRLSGATTGEATSAAVQLSQGLASGQLRGQELRSVLEANVVVGQLLAKTFGVTRGELFKLAEQGQLTAAKVFKALLTSQQELQEETEKLGITYGQVFTQALDKARVAIADFSKQIDGPRRLNDLIQFAFDNITLLAGVIGSVLIPLIAIKLKAAIAGLVALLGVPGAIFAGIAVSISALANAVGGFGNLGVLTFNLLVDSLRSLINTFEVLSVAGPAAFDAIFGTDTSKKVTDFFDNIDNRLAGTKKNLSGLSTGSEVPFFERDPVDNNVFNLGIVQFPKVKKELNDISNLVDKIPDEKFSKINRELQAGVITLEEYAIELAKVESTLSRNSFEKGTKDVFSYREELRKTRELELNKLFKDNAISAQQFDIALREIKLEELNDKLDQNKISLKEFNKELTDINDKFGRGNFLERGAREYIDSIGTLANQLSSTIQNAFGSLEDALFDFTKNGKFNFKDFAQSVLDDLNRILIRTLIVQNIARGVGSFFGGISGLSDSNVNNLPGAGGDGTGSFGDLFQAPASNIPLNPGIASAKLGGGELQSSGMTVNVINNSSDTAIEQRERTDGDGTKVLDVIIFNKVKEGISRGVFDRDFTANYGLKRRGV